MSWLKLSRPLRIPQALNAMTLARWGSSSVSTLISSENDHQNLVTLFVVKEVMLATHCYPINLDYSGKVGLIYALGLVTSSSGCNTVCWGLGEGLWAPVTPIKVTTIGVRAIEKKFLNPLKSSFCVTLNEFEGKQNLSFIFVLEDKLTYVRNVSTKFAALRCCNLMRCVARHFDILFTN